MTGEGRCAHPNNTDDGNNTGIDPVVIEPSAIAAQAPPPE
jgi:hypothetical protein